eukprot:3435372-Prymnesium_polylepis.1
MRRLWRGSLRGPRRSVSRARHQSGHACRRRRLRSLRGRPRRWHQRRARCRGRACRVLGLHEILPSGYQAVGTPHRLRIDAVNIPDAVDCLADAGGAQRVDAHVARLEFAQHVQHRLLGVLLWLLARLAQQLGECHEAIVYHQRALRGRTKRERRAATTARCSRTAATAACNAPGVEAIQLRLKLEALAGRLPWRRGCRSFLFHGWRRRDRQQPPDGVCAARSEP